MNGVSKCPTCKRTFINEEMKNHVCCLPQYRGYGFGGHGVSGSFKEISYDNGLTWRKLTETKYLESHAHIHSEPVQCPINKQNPRFELSPKVKRHRRSPDNDTRTPFGEPHENVGREKSRDS